MHFVCCRNLGLLSIIHMPKGSKAVCGSFDLALFAPRHLLFNPCNSRPLLRLRQATTLHDAAVLACPQAFTLPFRLKYQALLLRLRLHSPALADELRQRGRLQAAQFSW